MAAKWRQAATTILLQRGPELPNKVQHGVQMLMLERSSQSSFMPNACVFPGGVSARVDYDPKWQTIFSPWLKPQGANKEYGHFYTHVVNQDQSERPPMLCDTVDNTDILPMDIAYRLCAIRETFEESGILLYKNNPTAHELTKSQLKEWRDRINKDSDAFMVLFEETGSVPDIWSLYEWTNWLTPAHMGPRRFDTMFYVACVQQAVEAEHDDNEIVSSKWFEPSDLIDSYYNQKLLLAPPQVFEVCRFLHDDLQLWDSIVDHVTERAPLGCERWLPVRINCTDGVISVLPGDELYPDTLDFLGTEEIPHIHSSIEESRQKCKRLHRMELNKQCTCSVACNIVPRFGHKSPLTWPLHKKS